MPWVEDRPEITVGLIGAAGLTAAIGLILPALTGIATVLTPLAATGLAAVIVLAAVTHARRGESGPIAVDLVVLVVAAFVAWGRFGLHPL